MDKRTFYESVTVDENGNEIAGSNYYIDKNGVAHGEAWATGSTPALSGDPEMIREMQARAEDMSAKINNVINSDEINEGIELLREAAERLRVIQSKVLEAETYCSRDSLKIDDQNVEYYLDECASYFSKTADFVDDFCDNVSNDVREVISTLNL